MKQRIAVLILTLAACGKVSERPVIQTVELISTPVFAMKEYGIQRVNQIRYLNKNMFALSRSEKLLLKIIDDQTITVFNNTGEGPGEWQDPFKMGISSNYLYVIDFQLQAIHKFNHDLEYLSRYLLKFRPWDIAIIDDDIVLITGTSATETDIYKIKLHDGIADIQKVLDLPSGGFLDTAYNVGVFDDDVYLATSVFTSSMIWFNDKGVIHRSNNPFTDELAPSSDSPLGPLPSEPIHYQLFRYEDYLCPLSLKNLRDQNLIYCFSKDTENVRALQLQLFANTFDYSSGGLVAYASQHHEVYEFQERLEMAGN